MNCAECQTDPLTPGHYCPCCGRKLSLEERRGLEGSSPTCATMPASAIVVAEPAHDMTPAVAEKALAPDPPREMTVAPPVVNADELKMAKAKEAANLIAQAHLAKAANPAPVVRRPAVPVPPPQQRRNYAPMVMMAAAVIVGVIGAAEGARRFGFDWPGRDVSDDVREAPPVQVTPPATASVTKVVAEPKVVVAHRTPANAPSRAASKPPATTPIARRQPGREPNSSASKVVPVVARTPAPETPTPAPTRASAPAAVASARPPAALTGRFFESNDVDEPPRIATRVQPRLPANLPAGADKKIAVARVLVSSTGHPHQVTLLRGAMLGRATDEAVIAALTQWTFSPAKKRGEPVNCWYNIGVPLGQAD